MQEAKNVIGVVSNCFLSLEHSTNMKGMFELTGSMYLPESANTKLQGLCKTRWTERHTCFDVFLEIYKALVTFLDNILYPLDYPDLELESTDGI